MLPGPLRYVHRKPHEFQIALVHPSLPGLTPDGRRGLHDPVETQRDHALARLTDGYGNALPAAK